MFEGTRNGVPHRAEVIVTDDTREIMGIACIVVRDTVTSPGALVEQTTDRYAQASNGDVWYFGEATAEFENGFVSNTHGSWEAKVDAACRGGGRRRGPQSPVPRRRRTLDAVAAPNLATLTTSRARDRRDAAL